MRRTLPLLLAVTWLATACGAISKDAYPAMEAAVAPGAPMPAAYAESGGAERDAYLEATPVVEETDGSYAAKEAPAPAPPPAPPGKSDAPATNAGDASTAGASSATSTVAASTDNRRAPVILYRADFTLAVFEVNRALDRVEKLAGDVGGYLARRDDRSITVRVPAAAFASSVVELEKVGDVLHRNVQSDDVTAEYRDLEVQLSNLRALRLRFEKLLEKAATVEDALKVERELGRITGEIERIKGRLKVLTDLAQYSTLTVRFEPRSQERAQTGPFVLPLPWLQQVGFRRLLSL